MLNPGGEWAVGRDRHAERVERYGRGRVRALAMAGHLREVLSQSADRNAEGAIDDALGAELERRAEKLEACGNWLQFHDYQELGETRLVDAKFCQQDRLCPTCALRRAGRAVERAVRRVLAAREAAPKLRCYLVTQTIRNGADLVERVEHLKRALKLQLQRRKDAGRGLSGSLMGSIAGGAHSIEIKRGRGSKLWHPHSHAVWLSESKPSQRALSAEWESITGDSCVVDVQEFRDQDDPAEDLCEVFKYALKLGDLDLADNLRAALDLHGRRLIGTFGCLRGLELPASLLDVELVNVPYVELLYRFCARRSGYSLVRERSCTPFALTFRS